MATTTNFGWPTPDDTDLVKNGAAAMRSLGSGIDTSLVKLKGGTTGQILSKASNTDLDYVWIANDQGDITAVTAGTGITGGGTSGAVTITNEMATTIDAKGDLIAGTADNAFARLPVGSNGQTLVADSSQTTGLAWANNFAAGKNKLINADFSVNQRSFSSITAAGYGFDRWRYEFSTGTNTYSAQTFTPGTAPVAGYEARNFAQMAISGQSATSAYNILGQRIEDVRTFAGQTITLSFWAKASSGTPKIGCEITQVFGTGGSPSAFVSTPMGSITTSTSWTRYSVSVAIPSISGKTIGTDANSSYIEVNLWLSAGSDFNTRASSIGINNSTFQIWGVQLEAGSVATAFQTATGTLAGELAACQRYFQRLVNGADATNELFVLAQCYATTAGSAPLRFNTTMRTAPTMTISSASHFAAADVNGIDKTLTNATISAATTRSLRFNFEVASGLTTGSASYVRSINASSTLDLGAEL